MTEWIDLSDRESVEYVALGVDQGITSHPVGVALVKQRATQSVPRLIAHAEIDVSETAKADLHAGILLAYEQIDDFLFSHHPFAFEVHAIGIEWPYVKHVQTALKLALFAGAVLTISHDAGVPFFRIPVNTAKKALVGYGKASKRDMTRMAKHLFGVDVSDHVADACGVALGAIRKLELAEIDV